MKFLCQSSNPEMLRHMLSVFLFFTNRKIMCGKIQVPLNAAAVVSFLLGACITSVIAILFVFLSDFMADPVDDGSDDDEGQSLRDEVRVSALLHFSSSSSSAAAAAAAVWLLRRV